MNSELLSSIEVFTAAIAKIRSIPRPHVCARVGSLYVLHDPPGGKNPRKTEIVTTGGDPADIVQTIQESELGWHYLSDIREDATDFKEIRAQFKSLGYRALATEWMFVHDLEEIPSFTSDPPVKRVDSQEQADKIPQLSNHKLKVVSGARDFLIWNTIRDYGRVRSVDVGNESWVQGLYVYEDVRRQGYGKALMSALLQSDRALGRAKSVLLASTAGATVYPLLGYRQIGVLQLFCPVRRSS